MQRLFSTFAEYSVRPDEETDQPDAYFYQPADMKPTAFKAFMDWYKHQKDKVSFKFKYSPAYFLN